MVWEAVYDDISVFSSATTPDPKDLPPEGIQIVKVDGKAISSNVFIREDGEVFVSRDTLKNIKKQRPRAVLREGRTCSTRRFHELEVLSGRWSPKNKKREPTADWVKDIIGWRLWTPTQVFDSKGILPADWLDYWASLPATEIQWLKLYENWKTSGGSDYAQNHTADRYFMALSSNGLIIAASVETDLETRYPGAVVKEGSLLPDAEFAVIRDAANAANVL